jgi:hypothetical protein
VQTIACNRLHDLEQRLAKWLLLAQDRLESSILPLTHDSLAEKLGANRPSVSLAARNLEERELISYKRGRIRIRDRDGLEKAACECYDVSRQALQGLLKNRWNIVFPRTRSIALLCNPPYIVRWHTDTSSLFEVSVKSCFTTFCLPFHKREIPGNAKERDLTFEFPRSQARQCAKGNRKTHLCEILGAW